MRGRKPGPTQLKLLKNNPGKRPINRTEPKPRAVMPDAPAVLIGAARAEWDRLAPILFRAGLLTEIDGPALAAYCSAWARYQDAERELAEHGPIVPSPNGYPVQSPYLAISNRAIAVMQKFQIEFGMTPSSRGRISLDGVEVDGGDGDRFELFLAKGPKRGR